MKEIFHILNDCNARVWKSQRIGGILLRDKIFRKMTGRIRKNEACIYRLEGMKSNFTVNKKKVWT